MRRLFEFTDQPWLPQLWRDLLTELLHYQLDAGRVYWPAIPRLNEALRRAGCTEILDLCSGSGGPLLRLRPYLRAARFTLSDRYPNVRAAQVLAGLPDVRYLTEPVDARQVPARLSGLRTLFTAFHHFGPDDARRVLRSAVEARAPIAIFEFTARTPANLAGMLLSPLLVWRDSWRIRPRRWSRLFWTYLVPVLPLIYVWDGFVSHWRSYSAAELRALAADLPGYAWEAGTLPEGGRPRLTYLIGVPLG